MAEGYRGKVGIEGKRVGVVSTNYIPRHTPKLATRVRRGKIGI